jgi:hypothetical protein
MRQSTEILLARWFFPAPVCLSRPPLSFLLVPLLICLPLPVLAAIRDFSLNRQKILQPSSSLSTGDLFGAAVTIDSTGSFAAVGAPGSQSARGKVYVFEKNWHSTLVQQGHSTPNAWGHIQTLSASDAAVGDKFGFSVALSAYSSSGTPTNVLVVGAPMASGSNNLQHAGKIYVFHRTGPLLSQSSWSQAASFTVGALGAQHQETAGGCFGASVAAFGSYVIAGCPRCDVTEAEHTLVFPSGLQQVCALSCLFAFRYV